IPPVDGRNIDPEIGALMGEGALQRVREVNAPPHGEASWMGPPPSDVPDKPVPTYYNVPSLKEPVWKWYIPAYFYAGGLAGAGAGLLGLPLTAYTGVLLAGTAVPLWQAARRELPILFACSGAAAASSVLDVLPERGRASIAVHRFGAVAKAAEVALTVALER